eukprot:TRINITY_DN51429_c0_g1_i1.p1 TRINITY_DN51429_c0_g1~~TRINITY_DN51429_c0_g1_i1.p1  ORF type:complete len:836 (-),score=128.17 TRINITY_DN51429_c0_g1_i1:867-3374(-)
MYQQPMQGMQPMQGQGMQPGMQQGMQPMQQGMQQPMQPMGGMQPNMQQNFQQQPQQYMNNQPQQMQPQQPQQPQFNLQEYHEAQGIRWDWLRYPSTKEAAAQMVIPFGCLFNPLKPMSNLAVVNGSPVLCKNCSAALNPYCKVDTGSSLWICPFCLNRNQLMAQGGQCPQELNTQNTTIEYQLDRPPAPSPAFFYVIDTCIPPEELDVLKDSLIQSLSLIPDNASIGLITYGTNVTLWEVGFSELHKCFIFNGDSEFDQQTTADSLGIAKQAAAQPPPAFGNPNQPQPPQQQQQSGGCSSRFIVPLSDCELTINSILEELTVDPWPVKSDTRPLRCTGAALSLAVNVLQLAGRKACSRVLMFVGGAATKGPGAIVSTDLNENLRTHNEITRDQAPFYAKSEAFYKSLSETLVQDGIVCDVFAGCLDQVGLTEMRTAINSTGGTALLVDTFKSQVFKSSFPRFFASTADGNLDMAFNATIELQTSRDTKIRGVIGPCSSLNKPSSCVAPEEEIGMGKTCAWQANTLNTHTTYAFYFDVAGSGQDGTERYFQWMTSYTHTNGTRRLRITTVSHPIIASADSQLLVNQNAFDQDCAAVLVARIAVDMMENNVNNIKEPMRWIDRATIKLVGKFGTFTPDQPDSLKLSPDFALFPVFMFHLRRSEFLQVFNSSPDETSFFRSVMNREGTENAIIMVQPTLHSYSFEGPPSAVLLDSDSVRAGCILLMDTFFDVVIHRGSNIAAWVKENYHERPEHESFRQLLAAPLSDAQTLVADRFPTPRFTHCDQNTSQARYLYNRINPSQTYTSEGNTGGEKINTDDASLSTFMNHLKKVATASKA